MKTALQILLLTSFLGLSYSCQDVIEIDTPQNSVSINIYGRITDTLGTNVSISLTADYFSEDSIPMVNDANVYLYEDSVMVGQLASQNDQGNYYLDFNGSIGSSYFLEVELPESYGLPTSWLTAPEIMTRVFTPDSMTTRYLDRTTDPQVFEAGQYALLYFTEPAGTGDAYRLRRWLNDSLFTQEFFAFDDAQIDGFAFGSQFPPFSVYGPMDVGDTIQLEISSVSTDYFEFISILNEQVFQVGGPFDPPPSPIIGNIYQASDPSAFGYGYFRASALKYETTVATP